MIEDILKDMKPYTDVIEFFNTPDKEPYNRTAKTIDDFEKIYKREFDKSQISDEVFFQKHLINIIEEKENIYEVYLKTNEQRAWREHATTLELIYNFKQWLISRIDTHSKLKEENGNDLFSIIDKNLKEFKKEFNSEKDYNEAIKLIESFLLNKKISIDKPFFVRSKNVKNMAFSLGEIWRSVNNVPINYEYLELYKRLFSIFAKHKIDKSNVFACPLYKYSKSKT